MAVGDGKVFSEGERHIETQKKKGKKSVPKIPEMSG